MVYQTDSINLQNQNFFKAQAHSTTSLHRPSACTSVHVSWAAIGRKRSPLQKSRRATEPARWPPKFMTMCKGAEFEGHRQARYYCRCTLSALHSGLEYNCSSAPFFLFRILNVQRQVCPLSVWRPLTSDLLMISIHIKEGERGSETEETNIYWGCVLARLLVVSVESEGAPLVSCWWDRCSDQNGAW